MKVGRYNHYKLSTLGKEPSYPKLRMLLQSFLGSRKSRHFSVLWDNRDATLVIIGQVKDVVRRVEAARQLYQLFLQTGELSVEDTCEDLLNAERLSNMRSVIQDAFRMGLSDEVIEGASHSERTMLTSYFDFMHRAGSNYLMKE